MGILKRFQRMWRADVHGLMDEIEDKGLLLKQYLREMEDELDGRENRLRSLQSDYRQSELRLQSLEEETGKLEQDLDVAISQNNDEIARMLIRKLKMQRQLQEGLRATIDSMSREIASETSLIEERRQQFQQVQLQAKEFFRRESRKCHSDSDRFLRELDCHVNPYSEPSAEEIEIELFRRKASTESKHAGGQP